MRRKQVIGNGQRRRSRAEVDQLVEAFEVSGLRRREFCLKHGVVVGTLDFWRKRRREEQGPVASNPARTQNEAEARLVTVELAGTGSSDADLSGGGSNRHAQRIQRIVWIGARPLAVRASERACVSVLQWTAQSAEVGILGWKWIVGVREEIGEREISLAGSKRRSEQSAAEPGRTGAAVGRDRSAAGRTAAVVPAGS